MRRAQPQRPVLVSEVLQPRRRVEEPGSVFFHKRNGKRPVLVPKIEHETVIGLLDQFGELADQIGERALTLRVWWTMNLSQFMTAPFMARRYWLKGWLETSIVGPYIVKGDEGRTDQKLA